MIEYMASGSSTTYGSTMHTRTEKTEETPFYLVFRKVADCHYFNKGATQSFAACIYYEGQEYMHGLGYIELLSSHNTWEQMEQIRKSVFHRECVMPNEEPSKWPIPPKAEYVLSALNKHASKYQVEK